MGESPVSCNKLKKFKLDVCKHMGIYFHIIFFCAQILEWAYSTSAQNLQLNKNFKNIGLEITTVQFAQEN